MRVLLALLLLASAAHAATPDPRAPNPRAPHADRDRHAIRRTVKRDMVKIVGCWEMHDVHARRIVLEFTIGTNGRVTVLTVTGGAKPLQDCVAGVVMRMKFPRAKDVTNVTYPLQVCSAGT